MTRSQCTCRKPGKDFGTLRQIERGDHAVAFHPLVDAELLADVLAFHDQEFRVELFLQFALPLKGEVGRADDQNALGEPAEFQFPNEEAGHNGFAGAGVVSEQESHPGELQEVVVNRLELMGQRVDPRDRQTEVGIELVGDPKSVGLESETEQPAVAVEGVARVENGECFQIRGSDRDLAKALRVCADDAHEPTCHAVRLHGFNAHRFVEKRADEDLAWARCGLFRHVAPL